MFGEKKKQDISYSLHFSEVNDYTFYYNILLYKKFYLI